MSKSDLIAKTFRGNNSDLIAQTLVGLKVERQFRVVPLDNDLRRLLHGL
jgi:hypothetical protein